MSALLDRDSGTRQAVPDQYVHYSGALGSIAAAVKPFELAADFLMLAHQPLATATPTRNGKHAERRHNGRDAYDDLKSSTPVWPT